MKLKKLIISTTTATTLLLGINKPANAVFGVGDVVFDPSSVAQAMAQVTELYKQYEQLKQMYDAVTGSYNVGSGITQVENILPGTWQDVVRNQGGIFGDKQATYDKLLQIIGSDDLQKLMSDKNFVAVYQNVRMGMAVSDASYSALSEHTANLKKLADRINLTTNIKEAQDLGNQIAIEQGYIESINAKLGSVQSNLISVQASGKVSGSQKVHVWNN